MRFFAAGAGSPLSRSCLFTHGGPADDCWPDTRDRLLICAADVLHETGDVPDDLWAELSAVFDEPQLLDLLLLAGWYHAISYVARAARAGRPDLRLGQPGLI